jgi:hypothetical protein
MMTKKQILEMGFDNYEMDKGWYAAVFCNINFFRKLNDYKTPADLIKSIVDDAYKIGIEEGKKEKTEELKKVLNISVK